MQTHKMAMMFSLPSPLRTVRPRLGAQTRTCKLYSLQRAHISTSTNYRPDKHRAATPSNSPDTSPYPFRIFRNDISSLRKYRGEINHNGRTVGLVPTMGALHEGHLALIRAAAAENSDVFLSVFVNPTQFGPTEDLATYPRTWDDDMEKLVALNHNLTFPNGFGRISAVFAPGVRTMYPTLPPSSEIGGVGR